MDARAKGSACVHRRHTHAHILVHIVRGTLSQDTHVHMTALVLAPRGRPDYIQASRSLHTGALRHSGKPLLFGPHHQLGLCPPQVPSDSVLPSWLSYFLRA